MKVTIEAKVRIEMEVENEDKACDVMADTDYDFFDDRIMNTEIIDFEIK